MEMFILGFPAGKRRIKKNIFEYGSIQVAAQAAQDFCCVYRDNIEAAKDRLMQISRNNFKPQKQ